MRFDFARIHSSNIIVTHDGDKDGHFDEHETEEIYSNAFVNLEFSLFSS